MVSPNGPDVVGYAEEKSPLQSSPQVRRRYSSCGKSARNLKRPEGKSAAHERGRGKSERPAHNKLN